MNQYFMPIYTTIVGAVIGILISALKGMVKTRKDDKAVESKIADALREGMAILLKRQLFEYYGIYEYQEVIPAAEWTDIEQTHDVYKRLGGNSTGDRVYKELEKKHLGG